MDAPSFPLTPEALSAETRRVAALARELLRDEQAAEDVAQETWLRFARSTPRDPGSARAWLRSVASRLSIEHLRTRARRSAREERAARPEALPGVEEEAAHAEMLRSVAAEVLALDEPYRTTVLLAYWRGWDARRIARETATPLATVRSRLARAHARLRERLDATHGREAWALALGALPGVEAAGIGVAVVAAAALALLALGAALAARAWIGEDEPEIASREPAPGPSAAGEGHGRPPVAEEGERTELESAPATLRVAGTVVDRAYAELGLAARPAVGLALALRVDAREHAGGRPLAAADARTDADGRFEVTLARPEGERLFLRVGAQADGTYRTLFHSAEVVAAESELALARAPHGVLHGTVEDERGAPLAGIELAVAEVAATSDAAGAFSIPNALSARGVALRSALHALLAAEGGQALAEGGFAPLRVRVGPAARLAVRVTDGTRGIAGATVRAQLAECERAALGRQSSGPSAQSDASGVARLDAVWAGRKLELGLTVEGLPERWICEAMDAGRLVLAGGGGRPIVAESGAELVLEARLDAERDVAGVVRRADGLAAAGADVEVVDLGRGTASDRPVLARFETDGEGRFGGDLRTAEIVGPLRVTASVPPEEPPKPAQELAGLGYAGGPPARDVSSLEGSSARVDVSADERERLAALELVLAPRASIRGRVLGAGGAPVARIGWGDSRVWAVPEGAPYHGHGVEARAVSGEPGAFEVPGLEAGRYDLFASEEQQGFYSYESFLHRYPAVEAGARGVELRLPPRREVRILVRLGGDPALVERASSAIALHRKLFPAAPPALPRAGALERVAGASGWPEGAALDFAGIGGGAHALGWTSDGYDSFEGRELALEAREPGWYQIGADARAAEGAGFWPQATPLLWFDEGEHVVELELVPEATVRGRVRADAAAEFLAVALVGADGEPLSVSVPGGSRVARLVDTGASGEFALNGPAGTFRLRAGSREELEQGRFRAELALVLAPGENPRVELAP